jgi:DNA-binding response OmpR family regulator
VEDDRVSGNLVKYFLIDQNYDVTLCADTAMAWQQFMKNNYDLCLLDIVVPGKRDGIELAKNIRQKNKDIPILLMSSKCMEKDKITGFESGADDYITKPFNYQILLMKIRVFLKRRKKEEEKTHFLFRIGDFEFDHENLILRNDSEQYQLTQKEADIVRYLCLNANRIVKREDILMNIWGKDDFFLGRSMDVFITKIRKYFKSQDAVNIQTIHGIGFKFNNSLQLSYN